MNGNAYGDTVNKANDNDNLGNANKVFGNAVIPPQLYYNNNNSNKSYNKYLSSFVLQQQLQQQIL